MKVNLQKVVMVIYECSGKFFFSLKRHALPCRESISAKSSLRKFSIYLLVGKARTFLSKFFILATSRMNQKSSKDRFASEFQHNREEKSNRLSEAQSFDLWRVIKTEKPENYLCLIDSKTTGKWGYRIQFSGC